MKYLTGCKPQDLLLNELSNNNLDELVSNIINKENIKNYNVLTAGHIKENYLIMIN